MGRFAGGVRQADHDDRGAAIAADRLGGQGPGEAAPGDRGADVGAGPERAGHREPAELLAGVCAGDDPRVQRHRIRGPAPSAVVARSNHPGQSLRWLGERQFAFLNGRGRELQSCKDVIPF